MTENFEFYKQIAEEWIPMQKFLGFQLLHVETDFASILIPAREEFIGDPRSLRMHGGLISLAMDATGGTAAFTRLPNLFEDSIATIDLRVDYMSPARMEDLQTDARVLRAGETTIFTDIKTFHPSTPEKVLAVGRAVYNIKPGKAKTQMP
ncbi:MAG: PaaI family thioesterase [Bacteroidota bacterium]